MLTLLFSLIAFAAPPEEPSFFKPGLAIEAVVVQADGGMHKRLARLSSVPPEDAALALRGVCADAEVYAQPMLIVENAQRAQVTIRNANGFVSLEIVPTVKSGEIELLAALDVSDGKRRIHARPTLATREGKWVLAQDKSTTLALRVHHVDTSADLQALHDARTSIEARYEATLELLTKSQRRKAIMALLLQ
ncbi:MAG: hypothetical protein ACI9MC_002410 [Kiritimatiellia bacterium]|jgi:hypothetical protein